jgi:hypothetical protein
MSTITRKRLVPRRLVALAIAVSAATGTAGLVAAADEASAMRCSLYGTQSQLACTDDGGLEYGDSLGYGRTP